MPAQSSIHFFLNWAKERIDEMDATLTSLESKAGEVQADSHAKASQLIADLQKRGVQVELCGATARAHNWGNADLLPGIKVNTDAMARTTQLVQCGFVKITE